MNYQEAEQVVTENGHLVGTEFRGKTISKLLIAPLKEVGIARLMYNDANEIDSEPFYGAYSEFEVWVIFDVEDWLQTGVLDKMRLTNFLQMLDLNSNQSLSATENQDV
jgi:hypothetical protein